MDVSMIVETDTPLTDIIEDRFLGYLGGDEAEAEKLFDVLNIANGLDGLDFSASRIEGGDLCINVTYVIEYQFGFNNFFGIDLGITEKEVTQEVRSKLWGV